MTDENVRPWLFRILRNHWYNEIRKSKREVQPLDEEEGVPLLLETPEDVTARRFLQSEVRDAVDSLPELYREVIVLREIENMTYAEISALLDCPAGTVMSRLARGRLLLRDALRSFRPAERRAQSR